MNTFVNRIRSKLKIADLLDVKRRIKDVGSTTGFIVGSSDSLLLFHRLDMDTFRLNGYTVLRDQDINHYRIFNKAEFWQVRAVKHFKIKPVRPPGISVNSIRELIQSAAGSYPLLTFHLEVKRPDVCYIGSLISMTERTVTIEDLDANGNWSGPRRLKFEDITRIDFGGGYEEALAVTAPKMRRRKRKST